MSVSIAPANTATTARVIQFPTSLTLDAGRFLAELSPPGEAVQLAVEHLIGAIASQEYVPFAYVRAAAQRILCRELPPKVCLRLADALALVNDPALTDAFAGLFSQSRADGDSVLLACTRRVLRGRAHYARLSHVQRGYLEASSRSGPVAPRAVNVIDMRAWVGQRRAPPASH